jgi:hypothetical protein
MLIFIKSTNKVSSAIMFAKVGNFGYSWLQIQIKTNLIMQTNEKFGFLY